MGSQPMPTDKTKPKKPTKAVADGVDTGPKGSKRPPGPNAGGSHMQVSKTCLRTSRLRTARKKVLADLYGGWKRPLKTKRLEQHTLNQNKKPQT